MTINILNNFTHRIFKDFTLAELEQILKIAKVTVFDANDVLVSEGDQNQILYIILSGKVKITKEEPAEGGPVTLAILEGHQVVGEISVLTGKPKTATVTALTETTALMLNVSEVEKNPNTKELHAKLLKNLTSELSTKLVYTSNKFIKYDEFNSLEEKEDKSSYTPTSILVLFGWKWVDILHEIPFLAQHGYDAIKISPPQEFVLRTGNPWWQIYQPVTYFLSQFYGNEENFKAMIDLCHTFNIKVYADLVLNHMAHYAESESTHTGTNGSNFSKYHYGPINQENDFYEFKDFYHFDKNGNVNLQTSNEDYSKFEGIWRLEHYDLLQLPKLNLENPHVISVLRKYVKNLLALGIDGFRIDAAKHLNILAVEKVITNLRTTDGLKPFIYQEYYVGGLPMGIDVYSYMEKYFKIGYVTSFNYGDFISDAINNKNNNLEKLVSYSFGSSWIHFPENRTITVLDNHDTERMMPSILNYKCTQNNAYVLAYIFMLTWPFGIPKIMSSFKFSDMNDGIPETPVWQNGRNTSFDKNSPWVAQHRWNAIANMVLFRNTTKKAKGATHLWVNGNQIAFAKSYQKANSYVQALGFVIINDTKEPLKRRFETGLPAGKYFDLIHSEIVEGKMQGATIQVENYGFAEIEVKPYDAVVIAHSLSESS